MARYLRAHYTADRDADGIGELLVEVFAPPFSGASSAWFNAAELVRFAESLDAAYPLSASEPIELRGGIFDENVKTIDQLLLGLSFYAVGPRGNVGCSVVLATPTSPRWPKSRSRLELELLTSYEHVRSFALGIRAIVQGEATEALLGENEG
jgi:hypothetical protein